MQTENVNYETGCSQAIVHDEQALLTTRPDRTPQPIMGLKISLYDLNAIETAVEIASTLGDSTVTALSVVEHVP